MVKLLNDVALDPSAVTKMTSSQQQSPVLSKAEILRSLKLSRIGPRHGKAFVGAGGLKPYRMPADGSKPIPMKIRTRKALRAPTSKENENG